MNVRNFHSFLSLQHPEWAGSEGGTCSVILVNICVLQLFFCFLLLTSYQDLRLLPSEMADGRPRGRLVVIGKSILSASVAINSAVGGAKIF